MSQMNPKEQAAYDKAVARIARAEREGQMELDLNYLGLTELDLNHLGLTELPTEIRRLTELRVLSLRHNKLTTVPDWLCELTQLHDLNLSRNQLPAVPDVLCQLTQLQSLNLSINQLTAVSDRLSELTQLQNLDLRSNQLTAIPGKLSELTQLETLDVSDNQLTAIPGKLSELTQLETLDVSDNQLTAVSDWLRELTQLKSLGLSNNRLTVVLDISDNQLTAVSDTLRELTQLRELDLSRNRLTTVPDWLRELTQLQELRLRENQLTAVPDWLRELTQLKSLDLSGNQLTDVPSWLGELTQLQTLCLDENKLKAIPNWLAHMPALKELYILSNPLTQPPSEQLGKVLIYPVFSLSYEYEPERDVKLSWFGWFRRRHHNNNVIPLSPNINNEMEPVPKVEKVLDSAIKKEIEVGIATLILVLIRDPDSKGLGFLLNIEPDYLLEEEDVRSSQAFNLNYPTDIEIVIVSPDFAPPRQSKIISITPDQEDDELKPIEFMLTPLTTGTLRIMVEVYQAVEEGKRKQIGSKPMHTVSINTPSPFTKFLVETLTLVSYGVNPQTQTTNIFNAPVNQGKVGKMTNTTDNRESGDNITVDNISDSSGVAIGSGASSTAHNSTTGDTFNISGDFRGANVNIKATLTNVQQTIGALPHADEAAKAELQQLISQLNDALQAAPADKTEDADAVAQMAETLVDAANSEKPNKMMVQITGDGLKKAAENLAAVMPAVVGIATRIITAVSRLTI